MFRFPLSDLLILFSVKSRHTFWMIQFMFLLCSLRSSTSFPSTVCISFLLFSLGQYLFRHHSPLRRKTGVSSSLGAINTERRTLIHCPVVIFLRCLHYPYPSPVPCNFWLRCEIVVFSDMYSVRKYDPGEGFSDGKSLPHHQLEWSGWGALCN